VCQPDVSKEFEAYKPAIVAQKALIYQTNERFFEAISNGDMELMKTLWLNSPDCQVSQRSSHSRLKTSVDCVYHASTGSKRRCHLRI
jgi:hypothetical protein